MLSVLSPRKNQQFVVQFMQQLYVDRFATIANRLAFKKSSSNYPLEPMQDRFYPIIHVGHNPFFVGIRALDLRLTDNVLEFTYKIATDTSDPFHPVYEPRSQSIVVDG
ncbi:hypothetical protein ABB27_03285 [Stenotrophomonas terrae]|uniref:Uncharacterized protein n=1 Tax=Stenotrophomonas terrae TaxID=405446 RepID=A0A0R0CXZ7_9GAMM|nr:hypothetical protein ABB27_03285 [Stenotrophomonas terrae]